MVFIVFDPSSTWSRPHFILDPSSSRSRTNILSKWCNQVYGTFEGEETGERNGILNISLPNTFCSAVVSQQVLSYMFFVVIWRNYKFQSHVAEAGEIFDTCWQINSWTIRLLGRCEENKGGNYSAAIQTIRPNTIICPNKRKFGRIQIYIYIYINIYIYIYIYTFYTE